MMSSNFARAPFLKKLAITLAQAVHYNPAPLHQYWIVFPNRRSGLFFRRHLAREFNQTFRSPRILGMTEFVSQLTETQVPDTLSLLIELYEVYKTKQPNETFEDFLPWGETILGDFNAVDRYLIDPRALFQNVEDWRAIEVDLQNDIQDTTAYQQFWKIFDATTSQSTQATFQHQFKATWQFLLELYQSYRQRLTTLNWAYDGMSKRKLCEMFKDPNQTVYLEQNLLQTGLKKIIFAGFADFTKAEGTLVKWFVENLHPNAENPTHTWADIYWDVDAYYLENPKHEAGRLLRKYFKQDFARPATEWIETRLATDAKHIRMVGVPLNIGQAQGVSQEITKLITDYEQKLLAQGATLADTQAKVWSFIQRTAIIIPDEKLLFPVLLALPPTIKVFNVTMGYPLRSTHVYTLFEQLVQLQQNKKIQPQGSSYYHRDLYAVLFNPYFVDLINPTFKTWIQTTQDANRIWIPTDELNAVAPESLRPILQPITQVRDMFGYLNTIVATLVKILNPSGQPYPPIENEFLHHFYSLINKLQKIVTEYDLDLSFPIFWRLFFQLVSAERTPFSGEPLRGLQIMGMFETRNLDFQNLFILSMNEGKMPPPSQPNTFIPYSLRKAYGLPTPEDTDAIQAYHFYRLLQRAQNIYFFYNTEVGESSGRAPSRYLLQAQYEWKRINPRLKLTPQLLSVPFNIPNTDVITVQRTPDVQAALYTLAHKPEFYFSASALNTYLTCQLQFYFQYVAGLRAERDVEETMEQITFGNIFHKSMEILYTPIGVFHKAKLQDLLNKVETTVEKAYTLFLPNAEDTGVNYLNKEVLKKIVRDAIQQDIERAPIEIRGVERSIGYRLPDFPFELRGIIDRIETQPQHLILDFKTGNVLIPDKVRNAGPGIIPENELFARNKPKYKEIRQGTFYAYLYLKFHEAQKPSSGAQVAMYSPRAEDYLQLFPVTVEYIQQTFEPKLKEVLHEIFNSNTPFAQTNELSSCRYCIYQNICHKDN